MIRKPKIGMQVRIVGPKHLRRYANLGTDGEQLIAEFRAELCDTAIIIDIQPVHKFHNRAPKDYWVRFDAPNYGSYRFENTKELQENIMRHKWEHLTQTVAESYQHGAGRVCKNCGKIQYWVCTDYDRMARPPSVYSWRPLAGKCEEKKNES